MIRRFAFAIYIKSQSETKIFLYLCGINKLILKKMKRPGQGKDIRRNDYRDGNRKLRQKPCVLCG